MNYEIKEDMLPSMNELISLYNNVGWINYTNNPKMLEKAYNNSLKIVSAWDKNQLIGIIRVVGDGHSIIYVQDLLVLEEYQGKGIGSKLLGSVVKIYENVYQKILLTEDKESTVKFYEHCGFTKSNEFGCVAFVNFKI